MVSENEAMVSQTVTAAMTVRCAGRRMAVATSRRARSFDVRIRVGAMNRLFMGCEIDRAIVIRFGSRRQFRRAESEHGKFPEINRIG